MIIMNKFVAKSTKFFTNFYVSIKYNAYKSHGDINKSYTLKKAHTKDENQKGMFQNR